MADGYLQHSFAAAENEVCVLLDTKRFKAQLKRAKDPARVSREFNMSACIPVYGVSPSYPDNAHAGESRTPKTHLSQSCQAGSDAFPNSV